MLHILPEHIGDLLDMINFRFALSELLSAGRILF